MTQSTEPDRPRRSDEPAEPGQTAQQALPDLAPPLSVERPLTGDRAVDDALEEFDRSLTGEAASQLDAATRAHRVLQARLTAPAPAGSPAPVAPGEARPGPRP
ncbi:MAG: hypothetical protein Q4P07_04860 [Ornithinimicrobium sp.]|uniref:hypothetical protein n=1 Tax=Ornithinimicrobium sp. TaxID=1977084 RepID=UPI0026E0F5F0|nr:hypothetical protein [Ornithinimicrobium sp.]MDO5739458.1 hypothetical protein [Ornithinimicrobium sp.]